MKKFMHMEDNEDGTMTVTMCIDGEIEANFLIPASFDDFTGSMFEDNEAIMKAAVTVSETMIIIPNEI